MSFSRGGIVPWSLQDNQKLRPPIEVFAGLEAVKASSLDVPGLPTREELQRWAAEHDTIETSTTSQSGNEDKVPRKALQFPF